jgi:hypothetical protein
VTINAQVAASCRDAINVVERLESDAEVRVGLLRESEFLEFALTPKLADSDAEKK